MIIYINNKEQEMAGGVCIADVLHTFNVTPSQKGIAIAVNNEVIPRHDWDKHQLKAEDHITLIKATQGG